MRSPRTLQEASDRFVASRAAIISLDVVIFFTLLLPSALLAGGSYTTEHMLMLTISLLTAFLVLRLMHRLIRQRQQEKILFDSIADGLIVIDKNKRIVLWNHAAERLFGYTREQVFGKLSADYAHLSPEHDERDHLNPIASVLGGRDVSMVLDNQIATHKNGQKTPVSYSIAPIPEHAEHPVGAVIVVRDVTKEKDIDRAKTEFVSLASHQLRTPLSAISWYTEMLMGGDAGRVSPEQMDYLQEIYHGNQRMTELVNALLNVSRLELGTLAIEPKPTDLPPLIESVLTEMKKQIDEKHFVIQKNIQDIGTVRVDEKLMRIIIQNLLTNAVKYTPDGGRITVALEKKKKNIEFSVADTGYGIPKNQQATIFTKLFRADNVREKIADGTGLGLYIIKMILENAGGSISFTSVENKGTTFVVTIPASGMSQKSGTKGIES